MTAVIANQSADWCTPGWPLLPPGAIHLLAISPIEIAAMVWEIPMPVCAPARNDDGVNPFCGRIFP